jgi:hypothetical protein
MSRRNWSAAENREIVADYFEMLRLQQQGTAFVKAGHNRRLRERLGERSRSSVEYKYQNISAALHDMGLPFVAGYWPARNYQTGLTRVIEDYLRDGVFEQEFEREIENTTATSEAFRYTNILERQVSVPVPIVRDAAIGPQGRSPLPRKFDYAARDEANRKLGSLGEEFVLHAEKQRLVRANRGDLAADVEWSAKVRGDGLGFDIRSFADSGSEILIEVKTTNVANASFPFVVSRREMEVSESNAARYRLVRVFAFRVDPRYFVLDGAVSQTCELSPRSYLARPAG